MIYIQILDGIQYSIVCGGIQSVKMFLSTQGYCQVIVGNFFSYKFSYIIYIQLLKLAVEDHPRVRGEHDLMLS